MQLEETSHQEWRFLLRVMMGLHAPMEDAADIRDNTEQLNSPNSSMSFPKPTPMLTDALGTLVVRGVGIALMFISTTVTARLLGPEEYGAYSAALALAVLMAALAPLGSDRILVRNLSTSKFPEEAGCETAIAHLCTGITAAVLVGAALTAWFLNAIVFDNPDWARTSLLATMMFVPLTVILLRQWLAIPIVGSRRAMIPEQTVLPFVFTMSLLLISAAGWQTGAGTAAATYAAVMAIVWIGSLRSGSIRTVYQSAWSAIPNARQADIRRQFRDGLPFVGVGIGSLLTQSVMPILTAATCGFEESAYFTLAFPYAVLAAVPLGVFNVTMIPRCARHYRLGEFTAASHAVRSAATLTILLAATLSIVIWTCSPILATFVGPEYRMAFRLLPPLLLGVIVDCLTGPTIPVLQTMKMEKTYAKAIFAFIPIHLCLVCWFSRVAGIEGAACAYCISRCLWNVIVVVAIYRHRGLLMLPYLHIRQAFNELPPVPEDGAAYSSRQSLWKFAGTTDPAIVQTRAA